MADHEYILKQAVVQLFIALGVACGAFPAVVYTCVFLSQHLVCVVGPSFVCIKVTDLGYHTQTPQDAAAGD